MNSFEVHGAENSETDIESEWLVFLCAIGIRRDHSDWALSMTLAGTIVYILAFFDLAASIHARVWCWSTGLSIWMCELHRLLRGWYLQRCAYHIWSNASCTRASPVGILDTINLDLLFFFNHFKGLPGNQFHRLCSSPFQSPFVLASNERRQAADEAEFWLSCFCRRHSDITFYPSLNDDLPFFFSFYVGQFRLDKSPRRHMVGPFWEPVWFVAERQ